MFYFQNLTQVLFTFFKFEAAECLDYQSMIIEGEGEIFTKCKFEELSEQKQSP